MHGCGWDSGAARERSSALAASVASRYALGADRWRGRCAPGRPWQPGHCLALRALGAGTSPLTDGGVRPELGRSSRGPGRSPRRKFCL